MTLKSKLRYDQYDRKMAPAGDRRSCRTIFTNAIIRIKEKSSA